MKVILGFANGNVEKGCGHVSLEIRGDDGKLLAEDMGSLPPSPQLWELYNSWKFSFRKRFGGRIILPENPGSSSSSRKMELNQCIEQFPREFNQWLDCDGFRAIANQLRHHLNIDTPVSFAIKAEDTQLRYLPWYLWELFKDYPHVEPALAFSKYEAGKIGNSQRDNVRILVVIGDSQGINTEADKKIIQESFGDAEIEILDQPSREKLDTFIRNEQGWDILAFLGHSGSGKIKINPTESLSLSQLTKALRDAIKRGLKLAIFNSCDGLGLVQDLRDLYLPHCIVMREPVPDKVAQEFIKGFLPAFKNGKSLSRAVREARDNLRELEHKYPCATWLPVLCQNPTVESLNWVHVGGKPASPYRGLFAFREEDADIFYGREAVSEELCSRVLSKQTLLAVVGASGSGKSSVVFAGLIPRLRRNPGIKIVDFRPGKNPFESLAEALAPLWYKINHPDCNFEDLQLYERKFQKLDLSIMKLQENDRAICQVINEIIGSFNCHLVVVADQFEELFTLLPQSEKQVRELFLDSLVNAMLDSPNFTLVLTLRADFFHHVIEHKQFAKAINNTNCNYTLTGMEREELQQAIKIPAEKQGVKLESNLSELLLKDLEDEAENLPLLEFSLKLLWDKQKYGLLTLAAYKEIGGLEKSLALHAEGVFNLLEKLSPEKHQRMERVFIQLVIPRGFESAKDTRNVVFKSELQDKDWDLITFLNQEDTRLVVINYNNREKQETVEIVHEALIQGWKRLSKWVEFHRRFRTWQERLKVGMKNWEENKHNQVYLLNGPALGEAEGWLKDEENREYLSDTQRKFILESLKARDREIEEEKRKQRKTILRLSSALAMALAATGFAGFNWVQAEIRATSNNLKSLALSSKSSFDGGFHYDAIMEAMKAGQLLSNTWWKELIPNNIRQEVKATLFNVINDSIFVKHTLKGHQYIVTSVVFSPDGKTIASASWDKTVRIWNATTGNQIQTLKGHQDIVNSVVFSPDGKTIASASWDKTVKIWDAATGKEIQTLNGHKYNIESVEFSPDGKTIVSASEDETVKIWDVATGKQIQTLKGHQGIVNSVVFSPDGKTIASASSDKTVKIWDAATGNEIQTLNRHQSHVNHVEFSPDGKTIASASSRTVRIWDAATGNQIQTLRGHTGWVTSVEFSPDVKTIASASYEKIVRIWDAATGNQIQTFRGHQSSVNSVKFSPDGKTIASASSDNTVRVWDTATGNQIQILHGHQSSVTSVVFSPDGKAIAAVCGDSTVRVWDTATGNETRTLPLERSVHKAYQREVNSVKFSPDGKIIASASGSIVGNLIQIWDAATGNQIQTLNALNGHKHVVNHVEFSPDGKTIASASSDKTVRIWDVATGKQIQTLNGHQRKVESVEFSPDGKTIASASWDKTVKIWDAATGNQIQTLNGHKDVVMSVEFSPDGKTIASASSDGTVRIWDAATGNQIQTLKGHQSWVMSVEFSPDGKTIASASRDYTVKIWDFATGNQIQTLKGHQSWVRDVEFSPDGKTIASASSDGTVRIWDAATGNQIQTLNGHQSGVNSVEFSPDGKTIASASSDKTVKLWNWDFEDLVEKGCRRLKEHLVSNPKKLEQLEICQSKKVQTAAASTLVKQGEELAKNGNYQSAVEKFRKAKKWNPKLDINPEVKASASP